MEFVISFVVFLSVVLMMAIGVIFTRKKLKGSCGGLASIGIEKNCDCKITCENESRLYQIKEPNNV